MTVLIPKLVNAVRSGGPMARWIAGILAVAAVAIVAVVLVAGGSDSDDQASAAVGSDAEAMAEFRECLTEHGGEVPEPPSGGELPAPPSGTPPSFEQQGGGPPAAVRPEMSEETQKAMEACADLMPEGSGVFIAPGGPPGTAPSPQN